MSISDLDPNVPGSDAPAGEGDDHLRAINGALNEAFPAVDGPITNTGAAGTAGDTDPPDAATWSQLFADVRALASGVAAGGSIQLGMCMVWNTAVGAIPAGWTLCNGININNVQVPNLVDRMVMGAGNLYSNGEVGGSAAGSTQTELGGGHSHTLGAVNNHTLVTANLPAHSHLSFVAGDNSAGGPPAPSAADASSVRASNVGNSEAYQISVAPNSPTSVEPNVSRTSKTGSSSPSSLTHTGNTDAVAAHQHDIGAASFPPFQALTWICYVGAAA